MVDSVDALSHLLEEQIQEAEYYGLDRHEVADLLERFAGEVREGRTELPEHRSPWWHDVHSTDDETAETDSIPVTFQGTGSSPRNASWEFDSHQEDGSGIVELNIDFGGPEATLTFSIGTALRFQNQFSTEVKRAQRKAIESERGTNVEAELIEEDPDAE